MKKNKSINAIINGSTGNVNDSEIDEEELIHLNDRVLDMGFLSDDEDLSDEESLAFFRNKWLWESVALLLCGFFKYSTIQISQKDLFIQIAGLAFVKQANLESFFVVHFVYLVFAN